MATLTRQYEQKYASTDDLKKECKEYGIPLSLPIPQVSQLPSPSFLAYLLSWYPLHPHSLMYPIQIAFGFFVHLMNDRLVTNMEDLSQLLMMSEKQLEAYSFPLPSRSVSRSVVDLNWRVKDPSPLRRQDAVFRWITVHNRNVYIRPTGEFKKHDYMTFLTAKKLDYGDTEMTSPRLLSDKIRCTRSTLLSNLQRFPLFKFLSHILWYEAAALDKEELVLTGKLLQKKLQDRALLKSTRYPDIIYLNFCNNAFTTKVENELMSILAFWISQRIFYFYLIFDGCSFTDANHAYTLKAWKSSSFCVCVSSHDVSFSSPEK